MGEQEKLRGAELARALWPHKTYRRDVTSIYFIGKSVRAAQAANALDEHATGKKVSKQAAEAAGVLLHDIRQALEANRFKEPSLDSARGLASQLEMVAPSETAGSPTTIDLDYVDVLVGMAKEALAVSSLVPDRHGCFGPIPKRRGCF